MFNTQAFISSLILITLLIFFYEGLRFFLFHKWMPARYAGLLVAMLCAAGVVAHIAYLLGY